jgi:threonine/homoserine/homoserine lactone efflux protein
VSDSPLAPQWAVLGSICVVLNTFVDFFAVLGADRMLKSSTARAARAKVLNRVSGGTMVALGIFLATAQRGG